MDPYANAISATSILAPHHVSSTQNSLQGALKNDSDIVKRTSSTSSKSPTLGSAAVDSEETTANLGLHAISLDQDMQRQLEAYNRSITIIVWYKADTEPIRLQHMNRTFPYFQLLQLSTLATDLGLSPGSYIDAFDPNSGKWEQHTMNTVRLVAKQQRLLYKTRRNLLEGLDEHHCLGLPDEVHAQSKSSFMAIKPEAQNGNGSMKRTAPEETLTGPAHKVHIPNNYYTLRPVPIAASSEPLSQSPSEIPVPHNVDPAASAPAINGAYAYQSSAFYPQPQATNASPVPGPAPIPDTTLPPHLANLEANAPPIPYHPHPPLKRWPNDYTVSELTTGFNAMELLIRQPPDGTTITQRTAFERVFGSRYVKSTVCRHRGVWRKAKGPLREQFEAMGQDERACWGEFVRRIEGRPPSKAAQGVESLQPPVQPQGVMIYHTHTASAVASLHPVVETMTSQAIPRRVDDKTVVVEEPVMASLQNPDEQGTLSYVAPIS